MKFILILYFMGAQAHVDAGDGDKKHVWPL